MSKARYRNVDGILLLDKPAGLSSNQALQRVRHLFQARKAGHTGSLDPLATGLLPICLGEATKIAGYLLGSHKAYEAELLLGVVTDTDDADGQVMRTRPVPALDTAVVEAALADLRGRIRQVPPIYSALKRDGVPMYKRVRRGEVVAPVEREVEIFNLELLGVDEQRMRLHVECSSGTYVRSLARDLGDKLGCGAHLTALRRLWVDPFREPVMQELGDLQRRVEEGGAESLDALLLPLEAGLSGLPAVTFDARACERLRHGQRFRHPGLEAGNIVRALDDGGLLIALIDVSEDGLIRIRRGFNVNSARS